MLKHTRNSPHYPVLLREVTEYLNPQDGKVYLDATFGAGGYSKAILEKSNCKVCAIDRDATVIAYAEVLSQQFSSRFNFKRLAFGDMQTAFPSIKFDGIIFDVGVSSMQLDQGDRGFSFMHHGLLDMRMDRGQAFSAYDLVNSYSYGDLKRIIANLGGEKKAGKIAAAIVKKREETEIKTTEELVDVIVKSVSRYNDTIHPATRTFQAIRIQVNDELSQLRHGLECARNMLNVGGRIIVVTFHSLEDKIVKDYFRELAGIKANSNRHVPIAVLASSHTEFSLLTKKAVIPSNQEIAENPRARSAKLRAVEKIK